MLLDEKQKYVASGQFGCCVWSGTICFDVYPRFITKRNRNAAAIWISIGQAWARFLLSGNVGTILKRKTITRCVFLTHRRFYSEVIIVCRKGSSLLANVISCLWYHSWCFLIMGDIVDESGVFCYHLCVLSLRAMSIASALWIFLNAKVKCFASWAVLWRFPVSKMKLHTKRCCRWCINGSIRKIRLLVEQASVAAPMNYCFQHRGKTQPSAVARGNK